MSVLQAARAYSLGLPLASAYSWGLNRATFIAAAKRGFKEGAGSGEGLGGKTGANAKNTYLLGDDMAFTAKKDGVLLFTFGGKVQTKEEFDKRVRARFGGTFPAVWKETLEYVRGFDKEVLLSREEFFGTVYRPVRDSLAEKWTAAAEASQG